MESLVLALFVLTLIGCAILNQPLLLALLIGYFIFFLYGIIKRNSVIQMLKMSVSGISKVKNILILFIMIGMMTALWRTAGTLPTIVCYSTGMIRPSIMVLMAFLLNCLVSFLTGTSFGTVATMGVICMTMAASMNLNPVIVGGAILSGIYFGDRCSPVSSSALLVAELTKTDIFENIRRMFKSAMVPFVATCVVYTVLGLFMGQDAAVATDIQGLFAQGFRLGWIPLLPAVLILVLAVLKVDVKISMFLSILASFVISLLVQQVEVKQVAQSLIWGYHSTNPAIAAMLNGGGVMSMVQVAAIVCLSSSYAGIFEGTGLLKHLKEKMEQFGERTSAYGCVLGTALVTVMIACNQSLPIILTSQICDTVEPDEQKLAIDIENTAVVLAPLIPWNIAGMVPLATISVPTVSILAACYLYMIPLWNWYVSGRGKDRGLHRF